MSMGNIIEGSAILHPAAGLTNGNPVAIIGFGPSGSLWKLLPDYVPIWTMNDAENYGIDRINLALEIHRLRDIILEGPRWNKLLAGSSYPVYMIEQDPRFPSSVKYPLDRILDECFSHIYVGQERARYLDSSFPYLLALAAIEGFNPIFVFGFEFRSDTEYAYQRVGAALLIGWVTGRGTTVILPENNALLPPTLYGYEDYQMISRQNLEQFRQELAMQESDWLAKINIAHTQVIERTSAGTDTVEAENDRLEAYKQMYMRSGAIQAISHLIDICDRKAAKLETFTDTFFVNTEGK